jgi:hypothetical protein
MCALRLGAGEVPQSSCCPTGCDLKQHTCAVLLPCRFALSTLLLYIAAVIYYLYVRIAFTLDMKDKW